MNYIERQKAIDLLKRVSKGGMTKDEIKADYVVETFLDLMKVASEPLEKLEGKRIFLKEPMRSFLAEIGDKMSDIMATCKQKFDEFPPLKYQQSKYQVNR